MVPSPKTRSPGVKRRARIATERAGRLEEVEGVGRSDLDAAVDGPGPDPGAFFVAPGGDRVDREDLGLGEVQERMQHGPLVVGATAVAQIDQHAAVGRQRALVGRVGDRGADRPVAEHPVADPRIGIRSADGPGVEALGREALGDEAGRARVPVRDGRGRRAHRARGGGRLVGLRGRRGEHGQREGDRRRGEERREARRASAGRERRRASRAEEGRAGSGPAGRCAPTSPRNAHLPSSPSPCSRAACRRR
jgi:hypothetical protein